MGFQDAVRSVLRQYAGFVGRAPRSEYWWFALFNLVTTGIAYFLDLSIFGDGGGGFWGGPVETIWNLVLLMPNLAVTVRRLHDGDRAGWWLLIGLIPLIGWLVLLFWMVRRGDAGPNRFGPDPLAGGVTMPYAA